MGAAVVGRPRSLRRGDVVGVVAPAGAVDGERLDRGVAVLREWGFEVRLGRNIGARSRYLAGSDAERLTDLHAMFSDPEVGAVFCARGGYGAQRIVPDLRFAGLSAAPKPLIGYSDITALLSALVRHGLPAVHGPMVATDIERGLGVASREHLCRLLGDPEYRWELSVPRVIRRGVAEGPLVGGCLAVLASLLGTPWAADPAGAILFLEDVNEPPFRIDRMLTQLRQAGVLDRVAGVVFGALACPEASGVTAEDVVRDFFADARYPVGVGLAAGHGPESGPTENFALPLGLRVRLDTEARVLYGSEPLVA